MSKELKIKEFLDKMLNQDNRATAFPFFYVIRTEVKDPAPIENADEIKWYWQGDTYESWEAIEKYCKENEYSEEDILGVKRESLQYGIKNRWEQRGMFLTETDAENHLKLNHYHYSHNAHTYVCHAWRTTELQEFFTNLIEHFDVKKQERGGVVRHANID